MEDLAKQIRICVEVSNDPVSVTEQEMPLCRLFGGMLLVRSVSSGRPSPLNDDPEDACGGMLEVKATTTLPTGAKSTLQEWVVLDVGKLTKAALEAVVIGRKPAAGAWPRRGNMTSVLDFFAPEKRNEKCKSTK